MSTWVVISIQGVCIIILALCSIWDARRSARLSQRLEELERDLQKLRPPADPINDKTSFLG